MNPAAIEFKGHFKIWIYDPSHSILLLRGWAENHRDFCDIRFDDVYFLQIPTFQDDIQILEISPTAAGHKLPRIKDVIEGIRLGLKIFSVRSGEFEGLIVAGSMGHRNWSGRRSDVSPIYKPGPFIKHLSAGGYLLDD